MYIYSPLDATNKEIRLLCIHPSKSRSAAIVCNLEIVSLHRPPDFEALSYTWGSPDNSQEIIIDGNKLLVRENANAALRYLRLAKRSRYIWIDAICINQEDKAETSQQIRLMQDVYGQATQVCIWLGEVSESSLLAIRHIRKGSPTGALRQWTLDRKHGNVFPRLRERMYSASAAKTTLTMMAEHLSGEIQELFDRPWWRRTWIIQEAVLAKRLVFICGTEVVDWHQLDFLRTLRGDASHAIVDLTGQTVDDGVVLHGNVNFRLLSDLRNAWHENWKSIRLLDVLYHFRAMDCTNAQDKIFGFIGMLPAIASMVSIPEESVPRVSKTYIQFAHGTIRETHTLDILNYTREWRQTAWIPRQAYVYNLFDQAKYYDTHALMKPAPDRRARQGWVRLPDGWQRVYDGNQVMFMNHVLNELCQTSPLQGTQPSVSNWYEERRVPPSGWKKQWDNVGCASVEYHGQNETKVEAEARLQREVLEAELGSQLPSWVPNWASPRKWDPAPLLQASGHNALLDGTDMYWASEDAKPRSQPRSDSTMLSLEGYLVDEIDILCEAWHPQSTQPPISRAPIATLVAWEEIACAKRQSWSSCPYEATGGRMNALCRTMIADFPGDRAVPGYYCTAFFEAWCDRVGWSKFAQTPAGRIMKPARMRVKGELDQPLKRRVNHICSLLPSDMLQWLETMDPVQRDGWILSKYDCPNRVLRACAHRALFVTKKGWLGLAPWNANVGDNVAILEGGKTPYILRQRGGESQSWELVGETYVYGMMGGEAMRSAIQQEQTRQVLQIS